MHTPPRILIADDHPHGVELLEAYLSDSPYDIRTAMNGDEAMRILKDWQPDLILLDIMMPRLSGFEVCRMIRSNPSTRHIGVIMVTALDQPSDVDRAVEAGTDDFITKPINSTELLLRIRALLRSASQADPLLRTLDYIESVEHSAP